MQAKKRAKSVKFGKKVDANEERTEEKKDVAVNEQKTTASPTIDPKNQRVEPVKEEPIEKVENKEEKAVAEVIHNDPVEVIEKSSEQTKPEEAQAKLEGQASITQSQEVLDNPSPDAVIENEPQVNENAYVIQTEVKRNVLRYFLLTALISFLIGLISMAGISYFLQKTSFELPFIGSKVAKITPSLEPTITVEPTKVTVVNLEEYNIEVLNGSETAGAASRLKTELTTDGFKVVSIGNAEKSDYTDTIISVKKKVNTAFLEKLKENLKKSYTLGPDSKNPVPEASEADVIITIGSNTSGN